MAAARSPLAMLTGVAGAAVKHAKAHPAAGVPASAGGATAAQDDVGDREVGPHVIYAVPEGVSKDHSANYDDGVLLGPA